MNEYGEALRLLEAQVMELRYKHRLPFSAKIRIHMADVPENRKLVAIAKNLVAFQNIEFEFLDVDFDLLD